VLGCSDHWHHGWELAAPVGRPRKLDEQKQREICAMLAVGCDRRSAAKYVGCTVETIRQTALRDREFAERLRHSELRAKLAQLQNIQSAGKSSWRASAWMLERLYPQEFARRAPDTVTREELAQFLTELGKLFGRHVTDPAAQTALQADLEVLAANAREEPDSNRLELSDEAERILDQAKQ
jgi:hypothetical protein